MQKVRSYYLFKISLELLIKLLFQPFPSRYFYAIAYIFYLALEEGSPLFKQIFFHFNFLYRLLLFRRHQITISFDFFS
jgi:hypothetical protein